jgi:hypothetical protein
LVPLRAGLGHGLVLAACLGLIAWYQVAARLAVQGARGVEGQGLPIALFLEGLASLALVLLALAEISAWRRGRAALAGALLGRLFVVLVGAWLALVLGPWSFHPARVDSALAAAGLVWTLLAVARRRRGPPSRWARVLGWVALDLALAAVILEGCLRLAARVAPGPFLAQRDVTGEDRIALWRSAPGSNWWGQLKNSRGFNDEEFVARRADRPLIALVGDSFGSCTLPRMFHYSSVLREHLPAADVANIDVPGIGPPEYLHLIRSEAAPLHPDLVIVTVYVGNDLHDDYSDRRSHRALRLVFDPENALIALVPARLASLRAERRRLADGLATGAVASGSVVETREQALALYPWLADPGLEPTTLSASVYQDAMTTALRDGCDPRGFSFDALGAQLLEMRDAARPARFAIAVLPAEFQVEDDAWSAVLEHAGPGDWERERPQALIQALCQQADIACLDLLPALRGVEPLDDGRLHVYMRQETHFNARGCQVAGRELAVFAAGLLGLEPRSPADQAQVPGSR